jgi:hypothetical protein
MQGSTERLLTMDTGYDRSDLELVSRHRPDHAALDPETVGRTVGRELRRKAYVIRA